MVLVLPFSSSVIAAACVVAYLAARVVLAVIRFRRYELAIPGPPTLPLLGNALSIVFLKHEDIMDAIFKLWGQRRDLTRASMFNQLFAMVSKPEDFAEVMRRKDLQDKSSFYYHIFAESAPSGLLILNGAKMRAHRAAAMPAFHPTVIESFQDVIVAEAEKFVAGVETGREVVIQDRLFITTAWNFCRTVVMSDEPSKEQEVFIERLVFLLRLYLTMVNERAFNPLLWPRWTWRWTANGRMVVKELATIRPFCQQLIADRHDHLKKVQDLEGDDFIKSRKSLLDVLLQKHREDPVVFSYDAIMDELLVFLTAATETSVSALNFAFKMLSLRPDLQQKVYEEVSSLLGSGANKRSVDAQDLPKLEYTERFLKETMRLFPTIPLVGRQVREETQLGGYVLPAGTTLVGNIVGLHRDPVTWPDPLRFDPDRFTPERSAGRHPYAYMPFSGGIRSCIGYKYAWVVLKTLLATTVRDFVVEPAADGLDDHTKFKLVFDAAIKLHGGVRVKLVPRAT